MPDIHKIEIRANELIALENANLPDDTKLEITFPDKEILKIAEKELKSFREHRGQPDRKFRLKGCAKRRATRSKRHTQEKHFGIPQHAYHPNAFAMATLRGKQIAAADLEISGGAYSLEQVQELMNGISRQAIDKRVQEGSLFTVPGPNNRKHYPVIQFNPDGQPVKGLKDVIKALPSDSSWDILNFLANVDHMLDDRKPIDVLKSGDIEKVLFSASRIGEMGN
ncbi:hypothetical protein DEA98_10735 [Brucella pseudogrignonensis]|uniref:Uncharacterized protein n=1 Tax=Brucella pseudogrignonensis TaxID=419475 RepID=A0A256GDG3_9HYPH|nr:hypothetical protein [Brucella pseudogrignonensis]MCM0751646.1 hypothetical protein [Brucella pseudogrignonensis]NNV21980.1 hypothetical protein [Brucella pseudogrignonensis]OYR25153.1 hypothetical protein CEV34_3033 [Brucella pseudogrignonensis]